MPKENFFFHFSFITISDISWSDHYPRIFYGKISYLERFYLQWKNKKNVPLLLSKQCLSESVFEVRLINFLNNSTPEYDTHREYFTVLIKLKAF